VSDHRQSPDEPALWYWIACAAVLVFGAILRFRQLDTSLFEDEVWVAELVRRGGWHGHSYSTPPLFYAVERLWALVRGTAGARLREPAAFFGVALAAVPLFANRDRGTRFLWMLFLICSSPLVFYSGRLKQYTLEAFVVAVLIVLFLRALDGNSSFVWVAFFAVATLGATTLYSTIFVIGAAALVAVPRAPRLALPFAFVFAAFAGAYFGYLAPGPESIALHGDMNAYFARLGRWVTSPSLLWANSLHFAGQAMNLVRGWWVVAAGVAVFCILRRDELPATIVAAAPVVAVAAASTRHYYPYGEVRLMIFAFPALYLLVALALSHFATRTSRAGGIIAALFALAFAWNGFGRDTYNATYMRTFELRPLYDFVSSNHRSGEPVFVTSSLSAPLRYYHPELGSAFMAWDGQRIGPSGWYVDFGKPAGGDLSLHVANAWAVRVSAPSDGGSAQPAAPR
jgi:hypothetical protein